MPHSFDLVVIGTGGGGSVAARRCRREGWRVALVDELPYGGTCALRGCDPKKVLVAAADLVAWSGRMQGKGARGGAELDWPALMRFKRSFTDPVPQERLAGYQQAGIATYHGPARFLSPERLAVGDETLESRHFLIAAGARPRPLRIEGADHVVTSTDFLQLERLPGRLAFVGGGYISFEFAHVAQRAGARALILSRGTPLRQFDPDLVTTLVQHTRDIGVDVRLNSAVTAVEKRGSSYRVRIEGHGGSETVEADLVVHGAGRTPHTEGLRLAEAEVGTDPDGGVQVNQYLQSPTSPRIYAAGDAAAQGNLPLTPVAGYQSGIVASNLLHGNSRTADYRGIPSVAFTIPPLAGVGLTEDAARRQGLDIRVKSEETAGWYTNRRVAQTAARFKTVVENGSDRILGAHLLGPHAEEVINLFALAIRQNLTATDLKHQLYAYPTGASDLPYMV